MSQQTQAIAAAEPTELRLESDQTLGSDSHVQSARNARGGRPRGAGGWAEIKLQFVAKAFPSRSARELAASLHQAKPGEYGNSAEAIARRIARIRACQRQNENDSRFLIALRRTIEMELQRDGKPLAWAEKILHRLLQEVRDAVG